VELVVGAVAREEVGRPLAHQGVGLGRTVDLREAGEDVGALARGLPRGEVDVHGGDRGAVLEPVGAEPAVGGVVARPAGESVEAVTSALLVSMCVVRPARRPGKMVRR
jgi:hypothetical protein